MSLKVSCTTSDNQCNINPPRSNANDLEVPHEDERCIIALQRAVEHLGMKILVKDLDASHEVGPTRLPKKDQGWPGLSISVSFIYS